MKKTLFILMFAAGEAMAQTALIPTFHGGVLTDFPTLISNATQVVLTNGVNQQVYDLKATQTINFWFYSKGTNASSSGVQTAYYALSPDGTNFTPIASSNSITVTLSGTNTVYSMTPRTVSWGRYFEWYSETNADSTYNNTSNLIFAVPK